MAIPTFDQLLLPFLEVMQDGKERHIKEVTDILGDVFALSEAERNQLLPSGRQFLFRNRVGWARAYLKAAKLVESTRRGYTRITPRGLEVLREAPAVVDVEYLKRFPEFREFIVSSRGDHEPKAASVPDHEEAEPPERTQEEVLEDAYLQIRRNLAHELLDIVKGCSPAFFETLVVDLLVAMGYGGSREDAAQAIGRTGDEGVDGIINQDRLGLDRIYIQAKRWTDSVGRSVVQSFAGALQGLKATKGVLVTTSRFTQDARDYAEKIGNHIVLVDGEQLVGLMIDYNVGVSKVATFELKRVDSDYFEQE